MKYLILPLFILIVCSCSHSHKLGVNFDKKRLFQYVPDGVNAPMQLNVLHTKYGLCYCSITLINYDDSWRLSYIEYNRSTISHHLHVCVSELEAEKIMNDAELLFNELPATLFFDDKKHGDMMSLHLTISSYSSDVHRRSSMACLYPEDIYVSSRWMSFVDYLKCKFPPFEFMLKDLVEE
jgi:hypothetical protein